MNKVVDRLTFLSECYESGDYVDISAENYFQLAIDEIERLEYEIFRLEERHDKNCECVKCRVPGR